MFVLAYHLHWSLADMMRLSMDELFLFYRLLKRQLEREAAALKNKR